MISLTNLYTYLKLTALVKRIKTLVDATETFPMRWLTLATRRLPRGRSEIAANLNVLHFLCEIC